MARLFSWSGPGSHAAAIRWERPGEQQPRAGGRLPLRRAVKLKDLEADFVASIQAALSLAKDAGSGGVTVRFAAPVPGHSVQRLFL